MFSKKKIIQKGYSDNNLNNIIQEVAEIPRNQCLKKKEPQISNNQHQLSFISSFHCQYREVERIYKKHWHILCKDRHLGEILPQQPKFIYRRAPSFGDQVVKKILDPSDQRALKIDFRGFYCCRKCICCRTVRTSQRGVTSVTNTDGETFEIKGIQYL